MIAPTSLEVYNFFNITYEKNLFELYTDSFDEFSYQELKVEVEKIVKISNVSNEHLQDEL